MGPEEQDISSIKNLLCKAGFANAGQFPFVGRYMFRGFISYKMLTSYRRTTNMYGNCNKVWEGLAANFYGVVIVGDMKMKVKEPGIIGTIHEQI